MTDTYDLDYFIRVLTSKLTLSIPKAVLDEAKVYSRKTRQPLSRLVSHYFSILSRIGTRKNANDSTITPRVRGITGLAKSDVSDKQLLFEALSHKYR